MEHVVAKVEHIEAVVAAVFFRAALESVIEAVADEREPKEPGPGLEGRCARTGDRRPFRERDISQCVNLTGVKA